MKSGNKDAIIDELDKQIKTSTTSSRQANHSDDAKLKCANKHRGARRPRRRWRGTSRPSARGGARGTGDQKTMDARGAPLQEGRRHLERERVREVRVPAHRQGGLADDLQDQVRDGRPPLLPARTGPSAARRSTRSSPRTRQAPRRAEAAYASVLCYQNIYDQTHQGRRDKKGSGNLPGGGDKKARNDDGRRSLAPKDFTDDAEGHDHRLQPVRLLHQAGRERRRGAGAARRGEVRARAHLLRGAALGGGGARLPRRRDELLRQGRRHLRRAALPRELNVLGSHGQPNRDLVLRRHGRRRARSSSSSTARATRRRRTRSSAASLDEDPVRHPAPQGAEARRGAPTRAAPTRSSSTRRAGDAYLELWREVRRDAAAQRPAAAVREAATRSSTTPRRPSRRRASSRSAIARAHGPPRPAERRMDNTRARQEGDLRDRR